jgi:maltooligosyltrehalose trehalohydrolase
MNLLSSHNEPGNGWLFSVWAPEKKSMRLHLLDREGGHASGKRIIDMQKNEEGYFQAEVTDVQAGDLYFYQPDGNEDYPDPASCYQPQGVHGPSEIVDHSAYSWKDSAWKGLPFADFIFYELHAGAFTQEGSFEAIIPLLDELAGTGINAIELMPVAQCPGSRNWGYDGVFPYAVQHSYGGPEGLKKLVDACHQRGIAVFLDVVYNHLGREGNYLSFFGPYFSDKYHTPWGKALNFDGAWSDGVREYVIGNVLHWAEHYHIDGLRLDAVHEIFDRNAVRIWDLLNARVKEWQQQSGRTLYLVAESDLNSPCVVRSTELGGYGFDAQWLDDFHHALYVLLDKEGHRHYRDFGSLEQLAKAYTEGFVHSGEYVWFRKRKHGASSAGVAGSKFIIFNQNHDLPGNRPGGERLSVLVDFARLKLAAAAVLLAPYVPLLFMGEEYGEEAPFYFFSDYGNAGLKDELREGRKKQFAAFEWGQEAPDPQDEAVFLRSKLQWHKRREGKYGILLEWHRQLIHLRQHHPLLKNLSKNNIRADLLGQSGLAVYRHDVSGLRRLLCLFNFSGEEIPYIFLGVAGPPATGESGDAVRQAGASGSGAVWNKLLSSTDEKWLMEKAGFSPFHRPLPEEAAAGEKIFVPAWSAAVYALG